MKTQNRIKLIAKNVRTWAEKLRNQNMYWDYDLGGMCGIASYELFKRLRRAKLKPTVCFAPGHAFIQCQGLIVDVTATQFNNPGILGDNLIPIKFKFKSIEIRKAKEASKITDFWKPFIKAYKKKDIIKQVQNWPEDEIHPELITTIRSI